MAGHFKWASIRHCRSRQDARRGSLWTRIIREVTVAARDGGPELAMNPRQHLTLDKVRRGNLIDGRIRAATGKTYRAYYNQSRPG
jgi:transcriptional/translational regulatory protein YebC/TACO1